MAKIIVHRSASKFNKVQRFSVMLDDKLLSILANDEKQESDITAGVHTLSVKKRSYFTSEKINFTVNDQETKSFELAFSYPVFIRYGSFMCLIIMLMLVDFTETLHKLNRGYHVLIMIVGTLVLMIIARIIGLMKVKIKEV